MPHVINMTPLIAEAFINKTESCLSLASYQVSYFPAELPRQQSFYSCNSFSIIA